MLAAILCSSFNSYAQQDSLKTKILEDRDKSIKYAYQNLNGIGIQFNYKKAYLIFRIIKQDITGEWEGYIVQYDWSGEEIEKESSLRIVFDSSGTNIEGLGWKTIRSKRG